MKSQKGQSLVEFALVIPVLLLLLFGIVDFGRTFHAYLTIDHAGREVAREVSIKHNEDADEDIKTRVVTNINLLTNDNIDIVYPSGKEAGQEVYIVITYPVDFLTPVIGNIIGSFDLENTTVMRLE